MLDILPALLWIVAAVIAVIICSITAIRGNIFSKFYRVVYPLSWAIGKKTQTSHQRLTVIGGQGSENATRHTLDYMEQSPERERADIIQRCYVQKRVATFG